MNIYEVVFRDKGKGYYFNGGRLKIPNRVTVIVETERGLQFGRVVRKIDLSTSIDVSNLKNVIRIATKKDYEQYLKNLRDAEEALKLAKKENENLIFYGKDYVYVTLLDLLYVQEMYLEYNGYINAEIYKLTESKIKYLNNTCYNIFAENSSIAPGEKIDSKYQILKLLNKLYENKKFI